MAELMSDRELRRRRRELQRAEFERRQFEMLEIERKEKEIEQRKNQIEQIRLQREQLLRERMENRNVQDRQTEAARREYSYSLLSDEEFPWNGAVVDETGYDTPLEDAKHNEAYDSDVRLSLTRDIEHLGSLLQDFQTDIRTPEIDALAGKSHKSHPSSTRSHDDRSHSKEYGAELARKAKDAEKMKSSEGIKRTVNDRKPVKEEIRSGDDTGGRRKQIEANIIEEMARERMLKQRELERREHEYQAKLNKLELELKRELHDRTWKQKLYDFPDSGMQSEIERRRIEKRRQDLEEEDELLESIENLRLQIERRDHEEDKEEILRSQRLRDLRFERDALMRNLDMQKGNTNSLATTNYQITPVPSKSSGKPKLPNFDGSQFDDWKLAIESVLQTNLYDEHVVSQVVRNSIVGKARKALLTLKPSASTKEIFKRMEDIYGNLRSGDTIINEFYSARQMKDESCSDWGVRIEMLFNKAVEKAEIEEYRREAKLKERFWRGLHLEKIKNATRSTYEANVKFEELRKKARMEELEIESEKQIATEITEEKLSTNTNFCQPQQSNSKVDVLLNRIETLENELKELKANGQRQNSYNESWRYSARGRQRARGNSRFQHSNYRGRFNRDGNSSSRWYNQGREPEQREVKNDAKPLN